MEQRGAPEFILEAFADPNSVRDVVRGILHTIFFLRYFSTVLPQTRDVLGLELVYVPEAEIETLIDQRVTALVRQLEAERHQPHNLPSDRGMGLGLGLTRTATPPLSSGTGGGGRGQITVQFLERRRRKTWYAMRGDDEVCWESWTVKVTVADPRTEGERAKVRRAAETTLQNTIMTAVTLANAHKDHIPPITTTESNPFPYQINIGPNSNGPNNNNNPNPNPNPNRDSRSASNTNNSSSNRTSSSSGGGNNSNPRESGGGPGGGSGGGGVGGAGTAMKNVVGAAAGGVGAAATGWATRMGIY